MKKKKKSEPKSAEACWNCEDDPDGKLKQMFVDIVQTRRIRQGQTPARRPVFLKPHGVACARFEILPDLPKDLRVGVFALKEKIYPRGCVFSSDTIPTNPDLKTTCGIGIKLFNVPERSSWATATHKTSFCRTTTCSL